MEVEFGVVEARNGALPLAGEGALLKKTGNIAAGRSHNGVQGPPAPAI